MTKPILLGLLLCLPAMAGADGAVAVAMPVFPGFNAAQNAEMLTALVTAVVVGMNCPEFAITDGEWSLLNGAADMIANGELALDPAAYDAGFFGPAFKLLDQPGTCESEGPKVLPLVNMLIGLGGSTQPQ